MPKMKTNKTVAKRFKKSAKGKVFHVHAGSRHMMQTKSRKHKRRLGAFEELNNPALADKLRPHIR